MTDKSNVLKLDPGVLSAEQQEKLKQFKIKTRIDNENYLRSHPELDILIGDFLRAVLLQRPVKFFDFAADLTCNVAWWHHLLVSMEIDKLLPYCGT